MTSRKAGLSEQEFIGKSLNKNLYNKDNVLVVPAYTAVTEKVLRKIKLHGIVLHESDVEAPEAAAARVIDTAYSEMQDIFREIQKPEGVMMQDIDARIVPLIKEAATDSVFIPLLLRLQTKDDVTCRHSVAVAMIASLLGKWLKLSESELTLVAVSALLHDVGKLKIPQEILNKPGRLSDEEYEEIKRHTEYGYELLKKCKGLPEESLNAALQHHERLDGTGYPYGLSGDQIHWTTRIVMVADIFHAMCSRRVYKDRLPFYTVVQEIYQSAFGKLDAHIVSVFTRNMMESLIGTEVMLTNGRRGTIVSINPSDLSNPLVRVGEDRFIDLSQTKHIRIERV